MTDEELLEWATKETTIRKREMDQFHAGTLTLEVVQSNAAKRRKAVSLSRSEAAYAISNAIKSTRLKTA